MGSCQQGTYDPGGEYDFNLFHMSRILKLSDMLKLGLYCREEWP